MLHLADAAYITGRSDVLLKLKPLQDTEAVVIEHVPGKGKYQGMLVALPPEEWQPLVTLTDAAFAQWLLNLAHRVNLKRYPKHRRGPKKPPPKRTRFAKAKHIATARLLAEERGQK